MALPHPRLGQVYVSVTPLVAGTLTLPDWAFLAPVDPSAKHMVPCMCFLVEHPNWRQTLNSSSQPKNRLMFDLGLRGKAEDYIPEIQAHLLNRYPVTHQPSAPETLRKNGIPPEEIETVILSHVHYDHHGDPQQFPNTTFLVGQGSLDVVEQGLSGRGSHSHYDKELFHDVKAVELSSPRAGCAALNPDSLSFGLPLHGDARWESCGPFTAALDLFDDGSTYIIPAPGHLPGHINLLCRTGPRDWVYLGGDVFHDTRLLTGEKNISTWEEDGHTYCVHIDKAEAERSIERIRKLGAICERQGLNLEVIAAHDNVWYDNHKDRFDVLLPPRESGLYDIIYHDSMDGPSYNASFLKDSPFKFAIAMSADSLALTRKNASEDIRKLAEEHLQHDLNNSDRECLTSAASKIPRHVTIGSLVGLGLGILLAFRIRSARTKIFNAFRTVEKPTHVKFADGREEAIPDITPFTKPSTIGDIAVYFLFSSGGLFLGGETGLLTGYASASRTISKDPKSKARIERAFRRFRADVLRKEADAIDETRGLSGVLGL